MDANDTESRPTTPPHYDKGSLDEFLAEEGLVSLAPIFHKAEVDLAAFLLLTNDDMVELGIKLGPRKKLLQAIRNRTNDISVHKDVEETRQQLDAIITNLSDELAASQPVTIARSQSARTRAKKKKLLLSSVSVGNLHPIPAPINVTGSSSSSPVSSPSSPLATLTKIRAKRTKPQNSRSHQMAITDPESCDEIDQAKTVSPHPEISKAIDRRRTDTVMNQLLRESDTDSRLLQTSSPDISKHSGSPTSFASRVSPSNGDILSSKAMLALERQTSVEFEQRARKLSSPGSHGTSSNGSSPPVGSHINRSRSFEGSLSVFYDPAQMSQSSEEMNILTDESRSRRSVSFTLDNTRSTSPKQRDQPKSIENVKLAVSKAKLDAATSQLISALESVSESRAKSSASRGLRRALSKEEGQTWMAAARHDLDIANQETTTSDLSLARSTQDDISLRGRRRAASSLSFYQGTFDWQNKMVAHQLTRPSLAKVEVAPDLTADQLHNVDMQGWLIKQGGIVKSWKRRWCVLQGPCLYYFPSPSRSKVKGMITLPSYRILSAETETSNPFAFQAYHPSARNYFFIANNREDMLLWMKCLQRSTLVEDEQSDPSVAIKPTAFLIKPPKPATSSRSGSSASLVNAVYEDVEVILNRTPSDPLGLDVSITKEAGTVIDKIIPNSLADRCGKLRLGDVVMRINGQAIASMKPQDITTLLFNETDLPCHLSLRRISVAPLL